MRHLACHLEALEASVDQGGRASCTGQPTRSPRTGSSATWSQATGAREVVKVKSIADRRDRASTTRCAARGITAVETDLAELIHQLSGDTPSHILVPAIHRNRAEIRELFRRELPGNDQLTDEPAALAEAARRYLRERFLSARVAISGANFAVAETGTVCVVESEGNGRMCTTLPQTLITVMGIEKVLPRFADLEVMLQLLPRSCDRGADEPVHVAVDRGDAGRWAAGVSPRASRRRPDQCARGPDRPPGAALHPLLGVPERLPGLRAHRRARLRLGVSRADRRDPDAAAGGAPGGAPTLPWASSLCGACYDVCPVKIDIPTVLVHLRGEVVRRHEAGSGGGAERGERAAMRAMASVLSSRRRYELAQRAAQTGAWPLSRNGRIERRLPGPLAGWTAVRDLPAPPRQTFRAWWRRRQESQ